MKKLSVTIFLALICSFGFAQNKLTDSLTHQLAIAKNDMNRVLIMAELSHKFRLTKLDSAMKYGQQALILAQQIKFLKGEASALCSLSSLYRETGELPKALDLAIKAMNIAEEHQYIDEIGVCNNRFGNIYFDLKEYPKARSYFQKAIEMHKKTNNQYLLLEVYINTGASYYYDNQLDSSKYYIELGRLIIIKRHYQGDLSILLRQFGRIQAKLGNNSLALDYFKQGVQAALQFNDHRNASFNYNEIAKIFGQINQPDSCIYYAMKGISEGQFGPYNNRILESATLLTDAYKAKNDFKQAYEYQALMIKTKESLFSAGNIQAMQSMIAGEEARRKEVETEKITNQNKLKQYGLLAGLGMLLLVAFFLYRNNRQKQKANIVLQEKNEEIQSTLSKLKSTQAQLIQSEKLASLGELTAGIAHEIQNPLNFVNNFSELSVDLVKDLKEEIEKPTQDKEYIGELFDDLSQNQEKINHHGKRASSIVKGMLEHSRASTGVKELTDINKLADEYLRLAYHGLRAKDNSFNADYELIVDENLPKIEVIPQDIGRVLLNLINNAFYAVNQRKLLSNDVSYTPSVSVSTEHVDNQIIMKVKDNGIGMSESVRAKVFQPFFTTKPTGQGTGLGLSLAYDIVTKGHGGTLEVESTEGSEPKW